MWRILILCLLTNTLSAQEVKTAQKELLLMGSRFELISVAHSEEKAWQAINAGIAEIKRIEKLISSWNPDSQTSEINQNAGIKPVKIDRELFELIYRSKKVSELTNGAFDITFASMGSIWKFDGSMESFPDEETVQKARSKINWKNIVLNTDSLTAFLKEGGMKIGFGAIGKGYAANRAKAIMQEKNILGGLVNAGGDLIAWGASGKPEPWTIKIADPKQKDRAIAWLQITDQAVVTSGDYERFFIMNGKRYAHIIDPRTGYPTTGVKSVSIICPDAELADALATAVFVMGKDKGLNLLNQLKGIEGLIITDDDKLHYSDQLEINHY
jgi:thiamine biosynthesis lipoprotein